MEYGIELGEIADINGNISGRWYLIIESIPQIARSIKLELDMEKTRIERHCGMMLGGDRYVRYVIVAPCGVNEEEWLAKAKKLEELMNGSH